MVLPNTRTSATADPEDRTLVLPWRSRSHWSIALFLEILDIFGRGLKLRCPCCGHGRLFRTAFRTYGHCSACGERFEREPGQSFGAIYINVGLSALLAVSGYLVTNAFSTLTMSQQLGIRLLVAALGPVLFFRLAKGLWTSIIFLGEGLYLQWPNR
ncbi:MAG TPA: hypothetical protein DIU48_09285 [Acidobacteria bacterium]|nr:hypothetical protein [Acidobacteriota bacterium]